MSGAREQVARLLALVPYLNQRTEVALHQAATDFGVAPEQIVKDLKVLWYCGLPGLGPGDLIDIDMDALENDGDGVVRIGNADYLSRPLRLGSTEASALIVALRTLRESSSEDSRPAVDRALAKLEDATADGSMPQIEVVARPGQAATAQVRSALERAISGHRQVQLEYYVPSRDETTHRTVDPLELVESDGHAYLHAWCHLAEGLRIFRLDRVLGTETLEAPAGTHDVAPLDLSEGLFQPSPTDEVATLILHPRGRWLAEYYPVASEQERPGGDLEVTLRVGDPMWLVRLMASVAPQAEVLAPEGLNLKVSEAAAAALRNYA